jgi:glycosyltransferase involved in cell wall biosynthesis
LKLSVVIPLHNEEAVLPRLLIELLETLETLDGTSEVILVDDGSTDGTWHQVRAAARRESRIRGVRLSRNFGHQAALSAGLDATEGDGVITMDGDLQHPPRIIPQLVAKAAEGFDVVHAVRSSRDAEGVVKRRVADVFYWVLNKITPLDVPAGAADFRFMSRRVVDALGAMPERERFLRGLTRWIGYNQTFVSYDRAPREAGATKYTLRKMVAFAWDGVASFSGAPLRVASWAGLAVSLLGWLYLLYVLLVAAFTTRVVPGWTSVIAAVLVLGGVQLICLGIFGQYLGRMFQEVKGRPLFLVWEDTRDDARESAHDVTA